MDAQAIPLHQRPEFGPEQWKLARRCLSALAVLGTGGLVGVAASMYLVNHAPLLLVALSPIGRHLILVAPIVDPTAFVSVVVARRMLFYTASFYLGRSLGPAGVFWIEQRAAWAGRFVRWLERLFARASRTVVFCFAGPTVSALAGSAGMLPRLFLPLAAAGLVVRMLILVGVAEALRDPILQILAWIDDNWIPGTVVLVTGLALYQWRRRAAARRAAVSGVEGLT